MIFQDNFTEKIVEFTDLNGQITKDDLCEYQEELPSLIRANGEQENRLLIPYDSFDTYREIFLADNWSQIE